MANMFQIFFQQMWFTYDIILGAENFTKNPFFQLSTIRREKVCKDMVTALKVCGNFI